MSKSKRQRPYIFGRVFFPGEKAESIPVEVRFQPLGNHVGNVVKLVDYWNKEHFPSTSSIERVSEAARIHDSGKPQRFEIQSKTNREGKFQEYIYSFKGHRFLAKSKTDQWAELLAIGHHDFSVKDITRDAYKLKKEPDYAKILAQDPLAYARELYILEMCDQIEAELACRVMEDGKQAESRTFMDFTIAQDESDPTTYLLDPWAFDKELPSIQLTFKYWSMQPSEPDRAELENCLKENRERDLGKSLDLIVKRWWQSEQGKTADLHPTMITLKPYASRSNPKTWTAESFYQQLANLKPNPMQIELFDAIYAPDNSKHPAILLKGPTGVGKTESVLFPALASNYRLILPLPARSLLEDLKERVEKSLKQFSSLHPNREISLVVDTGSQMYRWIYKNGDEVKVKRTLNPRRHLYKGDVILTTLDKFLYRYFAFGDKQKSFTFPLRIHQEKVLICFDEAHSYDEISFTNFQSLVKSLYEAGRSLVLMTATLAKQHHDYFDYLDLIDYIDDDERAKAIHRFQQQILKQPYLNQQSFKWVSDLVRNQENPTVFQQEFTQIILKEWQAKAECRMIVVVERVTDAAEIYRQLKQALGSNQDSQGQFLFLYHGRIADQLRPELYQKLQARDAACQFYLLVTTSAIEVGCDLNAEILISEICSPENLIQRVGRCNRKGNIPNAKVILVGNSIPKFADSLDEAGWQEYQKVLRSLQTFAPQAITECITRLQHIDDYRVVELFSMLHDYVYSADLTCQPIHERGLIPTRSWTPSAELRLLRDEIEHSISVPIDRLCDGQKYAFTFVYESRYDKENTRWNEYRLGWGSAYGKNLIVKICPGLSAFTFDNSLPEYPYDPELGFVELPKIFSAKWIDGAEVKLKYEEGDRKAIISYTKSLD